MSRSLNGIVIAEAGSVHDGSFGNACALVDMAAEAGADVVKFQTHIAAAETLRDAPQPTYFTGEPRFEYFERTGFAFDQWLALKRHCDARSIRFMSSPFSVEAVDLLEQIGADIYKVPSGEVTNVFLLRRLVATRKPVILSSGMSNWAELDLAVAILRDCPELVVLQCSSAYPCPPEQVGLNVLQEMRTRYEIPVGLSDHTLGSAAAFAAAALGAKVIEKHTTFSRLMYGSDARHSMEPAEFRVFCSGLKDIWRMLENPVDKADLTPYLNMKRVFEKSLVTARSLSAGHRIAQQDLAAKKPGDGIPTIEYEQVVGRKLLHAVPADHKLDWNDIAS